MCHSKNPRLLLFTATIFKTDFYLYWFNIIRIDLWKKIARETPLFDVQIHDSTNPPLKVISLLGKNTASCFIIEIPTQTCCGEIIEIIRKIMVSTSFSHQNFAENPPGSALLAARAIRVRKGRPGAWRWRTLRRAEACWGKSMGRWWGFHLDLMLISDVAI